MKTSPIHQFTHFVLAFLLVTNPLLAAFFPLLPTPLAPASVEAASKQPTALARTLRAGDNSVSITDGAFVPEVITITVGSSVTWVNNGTVAHQVMSGIPPTSTATPSPTVSETPTVSATPTDGPSPTASATATEGPSPTASATATEGPSPTASATATEGSSPSPTASATGGAATATVTTVPTQDDHLLYLPLILRSGETVARQSVTLPSHLAAGDWASGVLQPGEVFSHTFTMMGTHNYYDPLQPELTGQVVVEEAEVILNETPAITITTPLEGAVLANGDNVEVIGTVTDDGTLVSVLVNEVPATLMGHQFSATISLGDGNQVITVEATDEQGAIGLASRLISIDDAGPQITIHTPEDQQAVYSLMPTLAISYTDLQAEVDTASLNVTLIDQNGSQSSVSGLTVSPSGALGTLTIPNDDRTYTLTVSVADTFGRSSRASSTFYVPSNPDDITPPDEPENAGWISGVIYDSTTCTEHLTECDGVAGVEVTLEAVDMQVLQQVRTARQTEIEKRWNARNRQAFTPLPPMTKEEVNFTSSIPGTIVTGPDGFFTFPVSETDTYWLRAEKEGFTYGQREADIVLERSTASNPIYVTPIDPAQTACDEDGCSHTSDDGQMTVDIPAGAIPSGQEVDVTATEFDQVEYLPSGDLPPGTWETYAFNLSGDSDYEFEQPVTVKLKNSQGFAPSTDIPLGYWNQHTQAWEHEGTGTVDGTGEWVVMQLTHFSNFDINFPVELGDSGGDGGSDGNGDDQSDNDKSDDNEDECEAGESGCFISVKTGTFEEEITLPTVNVLGEEIAPTLSYNSNRAYPAEIIDFKFTLNPDSGVQLGDYIAFELYIEGLQTDTFVFSNSVENGEVGRFRYLWEGRNAQGELLPPGIYSYAAKFRVPYQAQYCGTVNGFFGNPPDCQNFPTGVFVEATDDIWVRGTVEIDPQFESPFGAGWILDDQQRLYEDDAGRILIADGQRKDEFDFPQGPFLLEQQLNTSSHDVLASRQPFTGTLTATPIATNTLTATPTATNTWTATPTATNTWTPTTSPTITSTQPIQSSTPTNSPTNTVTPSVTNTHTPGASSTPTSSPTITSTQPIQSPTVIPPSQTATTIATFIPTVTGTPPSQTATATATFIPTVTGTPPAQTATTTATFIPTITGTLPVQTPPATATFIPTVTGTPPTPTATNVATSGTSTDYSQLTWDSITNTFARIYLDGTQVHFNTDGTHNYTLAPDGRKTLYSYNDDQSVATMAIIPPSEETPRWTWNFNYSGGKLSSITDPAGRETFFTVDGQGNLTQITMPDGGTQQFAYNANHLPTHYTDENGDVTSHTFDDFGRITSLTEPPRAVYNPETGQTEVIQEVLTFTPSDTSYDLINDSIVGDPEQPASAMPTSEELVDRVEYGRGTRSGYTNKWGAWLEQTDGEGRTTFYERDEYNNVTRETEPNGDCIEWTYDENGNALTEERMGAAACNQARALRDSSQVQSWTYTYEERFNQIKSSTDPLGNTTTYFYDYEEGIGEAGKLIRIEYPPVEDENGQFTTPTVSYTYNLWGLLETETDQRGSVTKYVYTEGTPDEASDGANALFAEGVTPVPGLLTQTIADFGDASHLNLTTIYKDFDAQGNSQMMLDPRGNPSSYSFDAMGRMVTQEDVLGRVTLYSYDERGNLIEMIQDYTPDGTTGRNVVTTTSYDADDRILNERTATDGIVRQTSYTYDINSQLAIQTDSNGNSITYHYDEADQLIAEIDPLGHITEYSYTLKGQLDTVTDPAGSVMRYEYDAFERQSAQIMADEDLDLTSSYTYDLNNNLISMTAPDGTVTCYTYDALNRRTSETRDCGGLDLTTSYTYNVAGDLVATENERGIVTESSYDALGRFVSTTQDANGLALLTSYTYDEASNLISSTDERGIVNTFSYDSLNRRTSMTQDTNGLSFTTSYGYDRLDNQSTVTDPEGIVSFTQYNAFGQPMRQVEDLSTLRRPTALEAETSYSYDNNLNLIAITDNNGNSTQYSYNARNEQIQTLYADGTTVNLTYNPDRTLGERTNQANEIITFAYDGAKRLLSKSYPDGSSQTFTYDAASRQTSASQTMSGHTTENTFAYNNLNNVINSTQSVDGLSWNVQYAYDYTAGESTISYPSGTSVVHSLDSLNRLAQVEQDSATVANYSYNDSTGTLSLTHANGVTSLVETDALRRITRLNSALGGNTPFADYRYGYDDAGNHTYMQRSHKPNQPADVYQYDGLYQLTQVWYGANSTDPATISSQEVLQSYQLDSLGNRLSVQNDDTSQSYQPNNGQQLTNPMNRYEQVDSTPFGYDTKGNLLTHNGNSYSYDYNNRQISMTGSASAEYIYNALGQRVAKVVDGVTTYYVYNNRYQVLEERDGSNTLTARYLYGAYIDEPLTMERDGATHTYHQDAQFSITEISDEEGTVVERYEYDVYGEARIFDGAGNSLTTSTIGNPYLYTARRYDAESGNYYFRARMYSAEIGRFLQMDPLGYVDGMNLYASYFVVNGMDPNGTDFIAVGTRWLNSTLIGWVPGANHMSLEYYKQDEEKECDEDLALVGDRFKSSSIPEGARRTGQVELLPDTNSFGRWVEQNRRKQNYNTWQSVQISVINRTSEATRMIVIHADAKGEKTANQKWNRIIAAAKSYRFAEQFPLGQTLKNWPDSKYNLPWEEPGNNSNTFVREMARVIQVNADVIGRKHPGADHARPVPHPGYTPISR